MKTLRRENGCLIIEEITGEHHIIMADEAHFEMELDDAGALPMFIGGVDAWCRSNDRQPYVPSPRLSLLQRFTKWVRS